MHSEKLILNDSDWISFLKFYGFKERLFELWITLSCSKDIRLFNHDYWSEQNTTPPAIRSSFSCRNRPMGFYADVEANCRVYYTCDEHGNKFTYRCPEKTAFRQDALVCDHAHLVNCEATIYPSIRSTNENNDENNGNATFTIKPPITSIDSINDNRLSFSRSFRVVQPPDKSAPNKNQLGFVFSGSVFLRDRTRGNNRSIDNICRTCNVDSKNRVTTSTVRTFPVGTTSRNFNRDKPNTSRQPQTLSFFKNRSFSRDRNTVNLHRSFESTSKPLAPRATTPTVTQPPPFLFERSASSNIYNGNYHSYSETLRSIQANAVTSASNTKYTTAIPAYALTLSLKPLVPNELPNDPYYPKHPTSTEAYYTPSDRGKINANTRLTNSSKIPSTFTHFSLPFKIPSVLPDLNSLEDLVDRRKFFYIPRIKLI